MQSEGRRPPAANGARAHRKLQIAAAKLLASSTAFASEATRQLVSEMLEEALGQPLSTRQHPNTYHQALEVFRFCAGVHDGLRNLLEVVETVDTDDRRIVKFRQLVAEWNAAALFADDDWEAFQSALDGVALPNLIELFRSATDGRWRQPPIHCETAWQMFVHLTELNASRDSPPPHMIFLDAVADQLSPDEGQDMRLRNRRRASQLGLTTALHEVRSRPPERAPESVHTAYLILQLEQDAVDPDIYTLSHWYQWDAGAWRPERGPDRFVRRTEIEARVEDIVNDMETHWPTPVETVSLEFILPWELINLPVDWWHKESASDRPTPLAMDYPVVVRSLERLRTRHWHRLWHVRWRRMQEEPKSVRAFWSEPTGTDYADALENALKEDTTYACVILSQPPTSDGGGRQEIEAALRAGVPVMVWHREDCSTQDFKDVVKKMLNTETLAQLPSRTRELRGEAVKLDRVNRDRHCGRHLTVLWDDPERQPEVSRPPSASQKGNRG